MPNPNKKARLQQRRFQNRLKRTAERERRLLEHTSGNGFQALRRLVGEEIGPITNNEFVRGFIRILDMIGADSRTRREHTIRDRVSSPSDGQFLDLPKGHFT